jgi:hypothetical protein
MPVELPTPITAYIAGSNAHDAVACAACFTDDAIVRDEGRDQGAPSSSATRSLSRARKSPAWKSVDDQSDAVLATAGIRL